MPWPEKVASSWGALNGVSELVANVAPSIPGYMSRGVPDARWDLRPSLVRLLPEGITRADALSIEKRARETFMAQAHLHLPESWLPPRLPTPSLSDWWAIMQHYSAPTRLLDWTFSLYVAAYFAVAQHWNCDGAIYLVHGGRLLNAMNARPGASKRFHDSQFLSEAPSQQLITPSLARETDRIVAQQGLFTVALDVLANHGTLIEDALANESADAVSHLKIIVPKERKPEFLLQLRHMNITARSLFPGADGLGRSVAETIRVARAKKQSQSNS